MAARRAAAALLLLAPLALPVTTTAKSASKLVAHVRYQNACGRSLFFADVDFKLAKGTSAKQAAKVEAKHRPRKAETLTVRGKRYALGSSDKGYYDSGRHALVYGFGGVSVSKKAGEKGSGTIATVRYKARDGKHKLHARVQGNGKVQAAGGC
jgi:hypothetical protein